MGQLQIPRSLHRLCREYEDCARAWAKWLDEHPQNAGKTPEMAEVDSINFFWEDYKLVAKLLDSSRRLQVGKDGLVQFSVGEFESSDVPKVSIFPWVHGLPGTY